MVRATFIGNNDGQSAYMELTGLSTDSKPTTGLFNGSIFVEVNTGKVFFFNEASSTWVEQFSFQD